MKERHGGAQAAIDAFDRRVRLRIWSFIFLFCTVAWLRDWRPHATSRQQDRIKQQSAPNATKEQPRARWAVAVLLSTAPASSKDLWKPRSVKGREESGECPKSRSLCAVLVLGDSLRRNGEIPEADFLALVDKGASDILKGDLRENGVLPVEMVGLENYDVFRDYILFRKMYVFKLLQYERVLLLDMDGVVTGSLRFLFESPMKCLENVAKGCAAVARNTEVCSEQEAEILAQQTSGTPVLTAYMLLRPSLELWEALVTDLQSNCGGDRVCDRRSAERRGWGLDEKRVRAPHDWVTRHQTDQQQKKLSWAAMGAGFSDQGFVEYFFAMRRRSALLVSKWSCPKRLHFLHFNIPPKPWMCPGPACEAPSRKKKWDSPPATLRYGGHHCAKDWWWQYELARPRLARQNASASCASRCIRELEAAKAARGDGAAEFANYTSGPRCAHLWEPPKR